MAYVLVDPSGKSNAKVGDKVVTGGGVFEKLKDGTSKLVEWLPTATGTTKNYADVVAAFSSLASGNKGNTDPVTSITDGKTQDTVKVDSVDDNGIASVSVAGYDPTDYSASYKTTSSTNISTVLGYGVLALVGIALLDRFMNGGDKGGK